MMIVCETSPLRPSGIHGKVRSQYPGVYYLNNCLLCAIKVVKNHNIFILGMVTADCAFYYITITLTGLILRNLIWITMYRKSFNTRSILTGTEDITIMNNRYIFRRYCKV